MQPFFLFLFSDALISTYNLEFGQVDTSEQLVKQTTGVCITHPCAD